MEKRTFGHFQLSQIRYGVSSWIRIPVITRKIGAGRAGMMQSSAVLLLALARLIATAARIHEVPPPPAVLWYAPFLSGGGYCSEAHSYVTAITAAQRSAADSSRSGRDDATEPFELFLTQHGDSFNAAFIRDLPEDMRALLEEVLLLVPFSVPLVLPITRWLLQACSGVSQLLCNSAVTLVAALTSLFAHASQHWIEPREFHWRLREQGIAVAICHSEPGAWHPARYSTSRCPPEGARYAVGRTMFETDRVPSGWADRMNEMDEIWVPTR